MDWVEFTEDSCNREFHNGGTDTAGFYIKDVLVKRATA